MERIEIIISAGTRRRLNRIKYLRQQKTGVILGDMEIVVTAVAHYWAELENRRRM